MEEELPRHEEKWKVVETPPDEQESAERVVFHHFSCEREGLSGSDTSQGKKISLLSKSRYPRLALRIKNPRTRRYNATEKVLSHQTRGFPMR